MNRLLGQTLAVVGLATLGTALFPACATNDASIFIRDVLAPPVTRINNQCTYSNDPSQLMISEGTLDAAVAETYEVTVLVGSQLIGRGDEKSGRVEPNRLHINGAVVRVTDPRDDSEINSFTSVASSELDPQTNNTPSFAPLLGVTVIDAKTVQKVKAKLPVPTPANRSPETLVVANIKVFGTTLGGVDVETGEFQFPVHVCRGCLVDFSSGYDPTITNPNLAGALNCKLPLPTGGANAVLPCDKGVNEKTPCQLCTPSSWCTGACQNALASGQALPGDCL